MRWSSVSSPAPAVLDPLRNGLAIAALVVAGLLTQTGCASEVEATCDDVMQAQTLEPGVGFGGLRLGMSQDEVRDLLGAPERSMGEAWEYPSCGFAVMFGAGDRQAVAALLAGDTSGSDLTERFTVGTPEGLGMGSSREEIVAAFGPPTETRSPGPGVDMLIYPGRGVTWTLRDDRVVHLTLRRPQ